MNRILIYLIASIVLTTSIKADPLSDAVDRGLNTVKNDLDKAKKEFEKQETKLKEGLKKAADSIAALSDKIKKAGTKKKKDNLKRALAVKKRAKLRLESISKSIQTDLAPIQAKIDKKIKDLEVTQKRIQEIQEVRETEKALVELSTFMASEMLEQTLKKVQLKSAVAHASYRGNVQSSKVSLDVELEVYGKNYTFTEKDANLKNMKSLSEFVKTELVQTVKK